MGGGDVPKPDVKVDPALADEQAAAAKDQTDALQLRLKGDTASVMARYGTRLALAGSDAPSFGGSPLAMR